MERSKRRKIVEHGRGKAKLDATRNRRDLDGGGAFKREYRLTGVVEDSDTDVDGGLRRVRRMLGGSPNRSASDGDEGNAAGEDAKTNSTFYRSNIQTAVKDLKEVEFSDSELMEIKKTPFWFLFKALYQNDASRLNRRCAKSERTITEIISSFDDTTDEFVLGGKVVDLTSRDLRLIFGILGGYKTIPVKCTSYEDPRWLKRCFEREMVRGKVTLYKSVILRKIKDLVNRRNGDELDVARLTHCYLLAAILAPNRNASMSPHLPEYLEKFGEICDYDWSKYIVDMLKNQIGGRTSNRTGGCTVLLPYWLCEHTTIMEPINKVAFPRFLRWDMTSLNKIVARGRLSDIKTKKVMNKELRASPDEQETVLGLIRYWDAEHSDEEIEDTQEGVKDASLGDQTTPYSDDDFEGTVPISTPAKPASVRKRRLVVSGPSSSRNQGSNAGYYCGNTSVNLDKPASEGSLVRFGSVRTSSLGKKSIGTKGKQPVSKDFAVRVDSAVGFAVDYCESAGLKEKNQAEMEDCRRVILEKETQLLEKDKVITEKDKLVEVLTRELDVCKSESNKSLSDTGKIIEDLKAQLCVALEKDKEIEALKREIDTIKSEANKNGGSDVGTEWESEKEKLLAIHGEDLKKKDECIHALRAELAELREPLSATQLLQDPDTLAHLETAEKLHQAITENDELREENETLHEQLGIEKTPVVGRRPRTRRRVSPSTIARNVHQRTILNDRKPIVVSPQPTTGELLDLDAMETPAEPIAAKNKKFRLEAKLEAVKQTSDEIKTLVREFWEKNGDGYEVWTGDGGINRVILTDITMLLHHQRLSSSVIDSWVELLHKLAKRVAVCHQTVVFSGLCWEIISKVDNYQQSTVELYIDSLLKEVKVNDTLYFPILAENLPGQMARLGDHWTLLKLDILNSKWKFYNPRRPRHADPHLGAAFVVCDYIETKLAQVLAKTRPDHPICSGKPLKRPDSEYGVQQMPDSLDCGLVVCYHIENAIFHAESQKGIMSKKLAGNYRKRMVEWFVQPFDVVVGLCQ